MFKLLKTTKFSVAFMLIIGSVLSGCATGTDSAQLIRNGGKGPDTGPDAPMPTLEESLQLFESMAFKGWRLKDRISRVEAPLRVSLFMSNSEKRKLGAEYRQWVANWATIFSGLTGRPIEILPDNDNSGNMRILAIKDEQVGGYGCVAYWPRFDNNAMRESFIKVPLLGHMPSMRARWKFDRPTNVNRCIAHEWLHALGFWRHASVSGSARSIMASWETAGTSNHVAWITIGDRIALKTLYHPRIKPNMTKEEAMPIAREVMAEIMQDRDALFPELNGITVPFEDTAAPDRAEAQAFLESTIDDWRPKLASHLGWKVYKGGDVYETEIHQFDVATVTDTLISAWVDHTTRQVECNGGTCGAGDSPFSSTKPRMVHFLRDGNSVKIESISFKR